MPGSSNASSAVLRLFGHAVFERDGESAPLAVPAKAIALLGILVGNYTRAVSRDWLAQTLWQDLDPADGRANLRRHLHLLTKALGEDAFVLTRQTAQWNPQSVLAVDAVEFDRRLATDPASAVHYYAGDFCAGVFDETLDVMRSRLRARFERALSELRAKASVEQNDRDLLRWLEMLAAQDPLDEQTGRELIELRHRLGDRGGALRDYNALAGRLASELGVEPEPETVALLERILPAAQKPAAPHNLTAPATSFVGRDRELVEIAEALNTPGAVSLVGAGGIGKSRLALRAAWNNLSRYSGGVWLIELATAADEGAIWQRIAETCGLAVQDDAAEGVVRHLERAQCLLLLDNCEHVLEHARSVISRILAATRTGILATSRKALRVPQERVVQVAPLQIPPESPKSADDLLRFSGSRLFLERAAVAAPAFQVGEREAPRVAQIVRRLDGLPLAIELVAARAHLLTLDGMLKRLGDSGLFAQRSKADEERRHRTLHAAIEWSYDLLSEKERLFFSRLSIFPGSFSLAAAGAICAPGDEDISQLIFDLVDASLVRTVPVEGDVRFGLLQTTQDFARERVRQRDESHDLALAHARYFAGIADEFAPLDATQYDMRFAPARQDANDFIAALEWCTRNAQPDLAARIADGVYRDQKQRGQPRRMLERVEALIESAASHPDAVPAERLARCHRIAGILANTCTEWRASRFHNEKAYEIFASIGNEVAASNARSGLAAAEYYAGNFARAEEIMLAAISQQERLQNDGVLARTVGFLGALYLATGRLKEARPMLERAVAMYRKSGDVLESVAQLKNLALTAYHENDLEDAKKYLDEVLAITARNTNVHQYADAVNLYGNVLRKQGSPQRAIEKHAAALELAPELEGSHYLAEVLEDTSITFAALGDDRSAAMAAGGADALRRRLRSPMNPVAIRELAEAQDSIRERLGAERYDALFLRGGATVDAGLITELEAALP